MKRKTTMNSRHLTRKRAAIGPLPNVGDEIFVNGVFCFNVTAMLAWLEQNPQPIINVPVDVWKSASDMYDAHIVAADLSRPIIIIELAPDMTDGAEDDWLGRGYVCIDGYHRLEKARRNGMKTLPAVVLRMEQHIPFMYKGFYCYVEYWNRKLIERGTDGVIADVQKYPG